MIKSIYIDNFKALNDFSINRKPLTILIGGNASGKSSILQAIDLVIGFVQMDIEEYIKSEAEILVPLWGMAEFGLRKDLLKSYRWCA